jgi:hypothetical protein
MKKISEELKRYNPSFSEKEIKEGLLLFEEKEFKANSLISKIGDICNYIFFAESSVTRCFMLIQTDKNKHFG